MEIRNTKRVVVVGGEHLAPISHHSPPSPLSSPVTERVLALASGNNLLLPEMATIRPPFRQGRHPVDVEPALGLLWSAVFNKTFAELHETSVQLLHDVQEWPHHSFADSRSLCRAMANSLRNFLSFLACSPYIYKWKYTYEITLLSIYLYPPISFWMLEPLFMKHMYSESWHLGTSQQGAS